MGLIHTVQVFILLLVEILDLSGRIVIKQSLNSSDIPFVDISAMIEGLYVLKTISSGKINSWKFMKL